MLLQALQKYLPPNAMPFIEKWLKGFPVHIIITRDRKSKLGDYRKMPNGGHQITINVTLEPELFFFVFTHEIAHLLAFEHFGRSIKPHGKEWKHHFRVLLLESLSVYKADLQPLIYHFSKSPKANFMASTDLVKYFNHRGVGLFLEDITMGEQFIFRNERYVLERKLKKNYLCQSLESGRKYRISPLAEVQKIE